MQSFFNSIGEYVKNFSNLFLIFLGAFALMSVIMIFITSFAYECKLTKTIDKINKFLERNPRINDDNLVAFNNLMKGKDVPKILRRQWQQFMLYREHPASYYMSFQHCVENPLRNSTYRQQMTIYKVISYVLVALSLVVSTFMAVQSFNANLVLQDIVIIPITILVSYWLISMVLDLVHSAVSGDLFQNYQYFEINLDKAMLTLPEFVDYEVLFSQDEIRRGIPVLFAYLQKRAIQEQHELEKARLKSADHEKFDFDEAGLDGSLVLDRAMRETENFLTQRKKYMQETERVNNEIAVLENNYKEQTKDFQRQVQTSKETVESLKEQLEQASSTIEINYIKKQMRDEINRQQLAERDFDILSDKHNQEIRALNLEIKRYDDETKKAKEALEVAMLSEFNTYSIKVYDNLEKIVDDKMQDKVDNYKDQIKGLEMELEDKNEELDNVYTRYQEVLSQVPVEQEYVEQQEIEKPTKKNKKKKKSSDDVPDDEGVVQPEQLDEFAYDENMQYNDQVADGQYYTDGYEQTEYNDYQTEQDENYLNNDEYVGEQGAYEAYDYSQDSEYIPLDGEYAPLNNDYEALVSDDNQYEQYIPSNDNIGENEEYVPQYSEYTPLADESADNGEYIPLDSDVNEQQTLDNVDKFNDSDFNINFDNQTADTSNFDDMNFDFDFGEKEPEVEESVVEETEAQPVETEDDVDFDLNSILGIYNEDDEKVAEELAVSDEQTEVKSEGGVELTAPKVKRKVGRPRKVVDLSEEKPKRKVGRPRKVVEVEEKPKRKVGRPRKTDNANAKRKVGRPKKQELKRKVGRPRKQDTNLNKNVSTGKRGRPRKVDTTQQIVLEKPKSRRGRPSKK